MNGSQPGPEIDNGDSRKRPLDRESDSGITKRSNPGDNVHFKILVPSIAAGAIIGKGGEAIAQIQKETGAKVKMSKANDFYPGTTERICLILGTVEAITVVHNYIMDRILEKPDPNPRPMGDGRLNVERHKQVKILVPNSTAGMIIGKSGTYIKEIKEKTSAFIQISQKSKEVNLPERCVTVAGEVDQNRAAVSLILAKISEDPQSASCPNISYADVPGPVASAFPTGSPYAIPQTTGVSPGAPHGGPSVPHGPAGAPPNAPSLNSSLSSSGGYNVSMESIRGFLRSSGYSEQATEEIANAMYTLANYGFLNISTLGVVPGGPSAALGNPPTPVPVAVASPGSSFNLGAAGGSGSASSGPGAHLTPVSAEAEFFTASAVGGLDHASLSAGPPGHAMLPMYPAGQPPTVFHHQSSAHQDHAVAAAAAVAAASGGYPVVSAPHVMGLEQAKSPPAAIMSGTMPTGMGHVATSLGGHVGHHPSGPVGHPGSAAAVSVKKDLEVPESLVGVILGPGGKGIVTLQEQTQTNIQISKKGVYTPGTRNRVVSIHGSPQFVMRAANIIQHRLNQEETRRQHQQPPSMPGSTGAGQQGGPPSQAAPPQGHPSSGGEGSTPSAHESPPHAASP